MLKMSSLVLGILVGRAGQSLSIAVNWTMTLVMFLSGLVKWAEVQMQ
jgi:hypothetical protein